MEIVVKRIAKKKTYTIGHLYILSDKDVKRTWRSVVKIGDKRIFEHSFDMAKLDKEHYFCDTLEPTRLACEETLSCAAHEKRYFLGMEGYYCCCCFSRASLVYLTYRQQLPRVP